MTSPKETTVSIQEDVHDPDVSVSEEAAPLTTAQVEPSSALPVHRGETLPGLQGWSEREEDFLKEAAAYLEEPSFLMKVADKAGKPLEWLMERLPEAAHSTIQKALEKALEVAVMTLPEKATEEIEATSEGWAPTLHTMASVVSGALGGVVGGAGLAVELPFSTGLMMRSIASVAQAQGEDIRDPAIQLECLAVLSHGAGGDAHRSMGSTYLSSRTSLSLLLREASSYVARVSARELAEAITRGTAPRLVVLLGQIANRFGLVVSQKLMAQSLPLLGALGGGFVNAAFTDHFNRVARYHFGIRKLERKYGRDQVFASYRRYLSTPVTALDDENA